MTVHADGLGGTWDNLETLDVDRPHGLDYRQLNHLAKAVRKRSDQEHSAFGDTTAGGIHKPGGSAVLGMEITDTAVDPTDLLVADGTYRGHGIIWAYDDASNYGTLWCATAAAGASTTGDWTLMKLHPDDQWGGGDVTWAGAHEFDASVDISGNVAMDGDLTVDGDLLVDGTANFASDVAFAVDISVDGVLKVDGTASEFGGTEGVALFYDPTIAAGANESNGEVVLPNGLQLNWGDKEVGASGATTITFADEGLTAFSNNCFQVFGCDGRGTDSLTNPLKFDTITKDSFKVTNQDTIARIVRWIAIGR